MESNIGKMIASEKITLFSVDQAKEVNPQSIATNRLLQISDEDYLFDPLNFERHPPKLQKHKSVSPERNLKLYSQLRGTENRQNGHETMSKTQNQWRKSANAFISGEEVCVMKRQRVLNLSNFLILNNNETNQVDFGVKQEVEEEKNHFRVNPPKSIVAFIRKRNISHLKEQYNSEENPGSGGLKTTTRRNLSPKQRMNMSCELSRRNKDQSPTRVRLEQIERAENMSPDMRCTSPSFRNKRISSYRKYLGIKLESRER